MADYRAIMGVSEAVIQLLQRSYDPVAFNNEFAFKLFTAKDFADPIENGVSLFVYRVFQHGSSRSPAGRLGPDGQRSRAALPVELHFLLTIWGKDASLQNSLCGWVMRTLEDYPTLSAGVLNAVAPGVFRPEESVDVCLAELRTEDLFRIWDVLGQNVYQLSIPYVARVLMIESMRPPGSGEGPAVQERGLQAGLAGEADVAPMTGE